jgi:two-component system, response regulator
MEQTNILLVDDNPDDIDLARRAFQKNNLKYNVIVTRDGAETLDYLYGKGKYKDRDINDKPRLILLDLKMPKVHGFEVLKQVRKDTQTKYIPVIILTSSQDKKDIIKGYELGANSYIVKPIDFIKFSEVVQQILLYWLDLNEQPSMKRGE